MKLKDLRKVYKYDEMGVFIIDVQLEDYRDAYSEWDYSPFNNRDLDEDLTEYLLDCSYEIPMKYNLIIDFHILNKIPNASREEKSRIGMQNFFLYQQRKLANQKVRMFKDIAKFLLLGSILLVLGFYMRKFYPSTLILSVLAEGFFIGGWVMLWEMFSAWFFDIKKISMKSAHFERLFQSKINFSYNNN